MAFISTRILAFGLFVVDAVLISGELRAMAQDCDRSYDNLVDKCQKYVTKNGPKTIPSLACCDAVKKVDINCVCSQITPYAEALLDPDKVMYVTVTCGKAIPHGQKCGSVTVP